MSEKIIHPESHKAHESLDVSKHHERIQAHHESAAEKAKKELSEQNLAELRKHAKEQAESPTHKSVEKHHAEEPAAPIGTQHALKKDAYEDSLKRVRRKLSKSDRSLSKVVHNKTVDAVSAVGAQTIARPSGLLGGSICAFFGSVVLLYSAKHYGFRYNYLMMVIFFVVGFLVGSMLELLVWATYSRKKQY